MFNNQKEKIFCGKGKSFGQYGAIAINVNISQIPESEVIISSSGQRFINLVVIPFKEPKDDKTHYVVINNYKKERY